MPERALPGVATNPAQPLIAVAAPATEREWSPGGVVVLPVNVTVVGTPAAE